MIIIGTKEQVRNYMEGRTAHEAHLILQQDEHTEQLYHVIKDRFGAATNLSGEPQSILNQAEMLSTINQALNLGATK